MHPFIFAALGDSISTGFNAETSGDNPHHSWTAGHHARLKALFPRLDVRSVNAAFNGARAGDLKGQVDRLLQTPPDYVTLLIGANDLARWLTGPYDMALNTFVGDVTTAIQRLVAANPRVMVLVVAIPDQSRVVHLLAASRLGAAAAPYLAALAGSPQLKQLTRDYKERWSRVNEMLAALASQFPGNVRFVAATAAAAFSGEHLSALDSYHPSVAGQRLLAELTWGQGFFPV